MKIDTNAFLLSALTLLLAWDHSGSSSGSLCHAFVVRQGRREPGAAPTYTASSPAAHQFTMPPSSSNLPWPTTAASPKVTLFMATSSSSSSSETEEEVVATDNNEEDVASMRIGEIKQELESYGISTKSFLEKSELIDALYTSSMSE